MSKKTETTRDRRIAQLGIVGIIAIIVVIVFLLRSCGPNNSETDYTETSPVEVVIETTLSQVSESSTEVATTAAKNVEYKIVLDGEAKQELYVGDKFIRPDFKVYDSEGKRVKALEQDVEITGDVDTSKSGKYTLKWSLEYDGRIANKYLLVSVLERKEKSEVKVVKTTTKSTNKSTSKQTNVVETAAETAAETVSQTVSETVSETVTETEGYGPGFNPNLGYKPGNSSVTGNTSIRVPSYNNDYDSNYNDSDYWRPSNKPSEVTPPAETRPAETRPVETRPAETEPAETNPPETNPPETGGSQYEDEADTNVGDVDSGGSTPPAETGGSQYEDEADSNVGDVDSGEGTPPAVDSQQVADYKEHQDSNVTDIDAGELF